MFARMGQRLSIHFVDSESRTRAECARIAFALGHHAEVYADIGELIEYAPREGVIVARADAMEGKVSDLFASLGGAGVWLPVIAVSEASDVSDVVEAIKAGALNFLQLPLNRDSFGKVLAAIAEEVETHIEARRRMIEARERIGTLSNREREVLDQLAGGGTNKVIARALSISPRTVEIHRANMMTKLDADCAVQAIRLRLDAQLDEASRPKAQGKKLPK